MGKQSKNGTGSGGDERNMYYRRYKSTSNPSKASTNDHLTKRLTDSESSSRFVQIILSKTVHLKVNFLFH